jgi:hypothetical protein
VRLPSLIAAFVTLHVSVQLLFTTTAMPMIFPRTFTNTTRSLPRPLYDFIRKWHLAPPQDGNENYSTTAELVNTPPEYEWFLPGTRRDKRLWLLLADIVVYTTYSVI